MTKLAELSAGDKVEVDGGFDCMKQGVKAVHADGDGLYVECKKGRHYLDGQEDFEDADLVGIKKVS